MKKLLKDLVKRYLLTKPAFNPGDLVKNAYGDQVYEVMSIYYSTELNPVLFIRDEDGRLYGVDPVVYVKYGGSKNI